MRRQLFQVLRTYLQRPLILVLGALAVLAAAVLFLMGSGSRSGGLSVAPRVSSWQNAAWVNVSKWNAYFQTHRPEEVETLHLMGLSDEPMPDLEPFTRLHSVHLHGLEFTPRVRDELASVERLEGLVAQGAELPVGTWTALGPKLRRLEIPARLLQTRADEIDHLNHLELLVVDPAAWNRDTLALVARLPKLKTLVVSSQVTDYRQPADAAVALTGFKPELLEILQGHANLQSIYLDQSPMLTRTRGELPDVVFYPAVIERLRWNAVSVVMFFSALIGAIVAFQAWVHFSMQQSVTIPRFAGAHRLAVVVVLLTGCGLATWGLSRVGTAVLPAVGFSLWLPVLSLCQLNVIRAKSRLKNLVAIPLALLMVMMFWLPLLLSGSVPPALTGEMHWFLEGEHWLAAVGLLLGEGVLLAVATWHLPGIVRQVYEHSALRPALSPWDTQQQRTWGNQGQRWGGFLGDRRNYPTLSGATFWQAARLWQAGNGYRPLVAMLFFGGMVILFSAASWLLTGRVSGSSMGAMLLFQIAGISLLMPVTIWARRCKTLQAESLRPVDRTQMVRQLFTALALDQAWAILPVALAMGWFVWFPRSGAHPQEPWGLSVLTVAGLAWIYALSTAIFAIRKTWVRVAYAAAMLLLPVGAISAAGVALDATSVPPAKQVHLMYLLGLVILLTAAAVIRLTYQRALHREWGLTAG